MCRHQPSNIFIYLLSAFFLSLCISLSACSPPATSTPASTLTPKAVPSTTTFTPLSPTNTPTIHPAPTATVTFPPVELLLTPTTTDIEVKYAVFNTSDNIQLKGKLYGVDLAAEGRLAVILAHQGTAGANQSDWQAFAELIAGRGFPALAFDFRGYGSSQSGGGGYNTALYDLQGAFDYLQKLGYGRIACMGASMGGTACLKAATKNELAGIVVISSPMNLGPPTDVTPEEIAALTIPKLFLTTENDRSEYIPGVMAKMYDISPEPKRLRSFPGTVHGTEMFTQPYGEEFTGELLLFLEALR